MRQAEVHPGWLQNLVRAGLCVPVGAGLGFLCALAILSVLTLGINPVPRDAIFFLAWTKGAWLGAIYVPIAYLLFLPKKNVVTALIAACVAAIGVGVIGDGILGPFVPVSLSASIGFWLACIGIYQHDRRTKNLGGFQSYFK